MLALAFFISVFSTVSWLIYTFMYIGEKLNGISFNSLGLVDISVYTSLVLLPILILWMVFGYINQYLLSNTFNKNLYSLFKQMKKNQDYTDLIARIMLEAEQEIKDGFILNKFDIFVSDMNELLSEIIYRSAIASSEQIERLWSKVQNGGKWSFGKVIVEVSQSQPNFQRRIFDKSQSDNVLAGTVLEFCARYGSLISLLEKHDKERVFLNIIETGIFGKVFSIMAPIADEIRRNREMASSSSRPVFANNDFSSEQEPSFSIREFEETVQEEPKKSGMTYIRPVTPVYRKTEKADIKSFITSINPFKKKAEPFSKEEPKIEETDPFSMALQRSFGEEPVFEEPKVSMPSFDEEMSSSPEISLPKEPEISEIRITPEDDREEREFFISAPEFEQEETSPAPVFYREKFTEKTEEASFSNTQKALNNLKKEWEEMKKNKELVSDKKTEDETSYSYPFGGWTNEENYSK